LPRRSRIHREAPSMLASETSPNPIPWRGYDLPPSLISRVSQPYAGLSA
jgi:hypothetical protein